MTLDGGQGLMLLKWETLVIEGTFRRRYKRFFADVEIGGKLEVAHVPNTGSMKSCIETERAALVTRSSNPERKLKFTLEALQDSSGVWVGVNTSWPNKLVREIFRQRLVDDWRKFDSFQPEVKINSATRLDAVLTNAQGERRFIEVKNVTMYDRGTALFPDAVTVRGQKHLKELIHIVAGGAEAEIVFVVQRADCQNFSVAREIDPNYANLLEEAKVKGVKCRVLPIQVSEHGFNLIAPNISH